MLKQTFDWFFGFLLCLGLSWGLCPKAFAQGLFESATSPGDQEEPEGSSGVFSAGSSGSSFTDFTGFVRSDLFMGKVPGKNRTEIKSGYAEAALKLQSKFHTKAKGVIETRLQTGLVDKQDDTRLSLREAYVDVFLDSLDLRLGHQIIVWGRADGINPTDNLTPKDLRTRSPDEDDRRAANLALRLTHHLTPFRTELVYVPFYKPSRFPNFDLPENIFFEAPDYPDTRLEHGNVAARVHVMLTDIELSLSYLFGYAAFPGLSLVGYNLDPNQFSLTVGFKAYQHHVIGLDFSTAVGDIFGLRGEAAVRIPKKPERFEHVPLPELQVVLGVDREFGDLSVLVQYVGKLVFDWDSRYDFQSDPDALMLAQVRSKTQMISDQTERLTHAVFSRLGNSLLHETLELELVAVYKPSTQEWMLRPQATYSITDGLFFSMGAELFGGPVDTLWGTIDETMSAGFFEIQAFF